MRKLAWFFVAVAILAMAVQAVALPADGVTVINNRDYYPAVMKLINEAEQTIEIAAYQTRFYEDYPGSESNNICDALVKAAGRGVKVLFLIDMSDSDWNRNNEPNADFARRLAQAGCTIYYDDLTRVSHHKLMVVDGVATVVGSVNWSHYSLHVNNEAAVIVWSRPVAEAFRQYIRQRCAEGRQVSLDELASPPVMQTRAESQTAVNPGMSSPEQIAIVPALEIDPRSYAEKRGFEILPAADVLPIAKENYFPAVDRVIRNAEKSVDMVMLEARFYRMRPGHAIARPATQEAPSLTNVLFDDLARAVERGVKVRMILDGGRVWHKGEPPDNRNLDWGLRARNKGCKVFWDSPDITTHAKLLIIDGRWVVVGSTNWSLFAVEAQNNEVSVLIDSPAVAQAMERFFQAVLDDSTEFKGLI